MAQIIVQIDDNVPVIHELVAGVVTIGRDTDNGLIIPAASVSRHHAEIVFRDGVGTLRDLNSANGTTVNEEPITEVPLKSGDVIHFGTVRSTFVVPPPTAPPGLPPEETTPRSRFTKTPVLIGAAVLLVVALAVAGFPTRRSPAPAKEVRPPPRAVVAPDQKSKATKEFWDRIQEIERRGNQIGHNVPLNRYPRLANGTYDLGRLNDTDLGSLRDLLAQRAQNASQVARDLAALDKHDVDNDLLAYTNDLSAQWAGAAEVDFAYADIVTATSEQRLRFTTVGAAALKAFDAASGENRLEREQQQGQDQLVKMITEWSAHRKEHADLTTKVLASETETNLLLTQRYKIEFK